MRRDSLLRSTPFRLALAFTLLFVCAFLLSGYLIFHLIHKELDARYDARVRETFSVIARSNDDSDLQDLIDATKGHIAATEEMQSIFQLRSSDGRILASNVPPLSVPNGGSIRSAAQLGIKGNQTYRIFAGPVGSNSLVVGAGNAETRELDKIVLISFAWASLVILLLAVAGGATIAISARRRLDAVRGTMERVAHGALDARIPLLGRGDDIDLLSHDINQALERLGMTVEGMRQVSADIAHDLKTPLNRLKIALEEARSRLERGQSIQDDIEIASLEVDNINQTFEALLRIAQIESGARKARFAAVDLKEVFAALVDVYREVAEDMGQELTADIEAQPPAIIAGDRNLLVQMYSNLIENALRHCPSACRIRVSLTSTEDMAVTLVEDNGPGIPETEREKVFRRLYRLEKSRTSPGTGLGLSLVRAIVDLHGGSIRLEDAHPGLRVFVSFPLTSQSADAATGSASTHLT
jgi:signal transduction histidine kinase